MFNTIPDPGFSKDDPWIFPSSCWIRGSNTVSKFASLLTVTKRVVTNMEAGMFLAILLCNIGFTDAAVTLAGRSEDTYNIGSNVTIGWNYDNETEMFSVDWTFQNSTADILIMTLTPSVNAVVLNGFNVVHNDNGKITLTDVQTYNSGTYKITVTYTTLSKLDPGTGSFKLTVSETSGGSNGSNGRNDTGPENPTNNNDSDSTNKILIIGIAVGVGAAVLLGVSVGVCLYCRHKKMKHKQENTKQSDTVSETKMHNLTSPEAVHSKTKL